MAKPIKDDVDREAVYNRWVATGENHKSLAKEFGISRQLATAIVSSGVREHQQNLNAQMALADPFNLFGIVSFTPYNPDALVTRNGIVIYDEMRNDDQIKAAISFKQHSVLSAGYQVKSPDNKPDDWEVTKFVRDTLDKLEGSFQNNMLQIMSAFYYGYSVTEKVFDQQGGGPINLVALKTKKPHFFEFKTDEYGDLLPDGLWQRSPKGSGFGGYAQLPVSKFVLYAHQFEFSNHYGRSDLLAAYHPWWAKSNAYKFLMILLERFGVPPVLAMYDPKKYSQSQISSLYDLLRDQAVAQTGVLPRPGGKDSLEMWAPELAGQGTKVFKDALDMYNRDISRALLMPGLLGLTPDQAAGSFARARVQFDVFMLIVEYLREEMREKVMMDQIIKPLVDLNFAVADDEYPKFEFLPLTDSVRTDIADTWSNLIQKGATKPTPDDEKYVRELLDFPEADDEELGQLEGPEDDSLDGDASDEGDGGDSGEAGDASNGGSGTTGVGGESKHTHDFGTEDSRTGPGSDGTAHTHLVERNQGGQVTGFGPGGEGPHRHPFVKAAHEIATEKWYVDVPRIEREMDALEERHRTRISGAIEMARDRFLKHVEKELPKGDAGFPATIKTLRGRPKIEKAIGDFLFDSYQHGRQTMRREIKAFSEDKDVHIYDDPNFVPRDAIKHLETKRFWVTGIIEDDLLKDSRGILVNGLAAGTANRTIMQNLREAFAPFAQNPQVIRDGVVMEPHRLETIVRTNNTDAFNQGRLVQARQAGPLLQGFEFSAVIDARTTDVCRFLDGKKFLPGDGNADRLKPPRHFNCRSLLVPIPAQADVNPSEFITASQVQKGLSLSGSGFGGSGRGLGAGAGAPSAGAPSAILPGSSILPDPSRKLLPERELTTLWRKSRKNTTAQGAKDGREHLAAYDEVTGRELGGTSGKEFSVQFTDEMNDAFQNPANNFIVHHNHPGVKQPGLLGVEGIGGTLSGADLNVLVTHRGVNRVVAHGAKGSTYSATATRASSSLTPELLSEMDRVFSVHWDEAGLRALGSGEHVKQARFHARNQLLDRLGLIKYESELVGESAEYMAKNKIRLTKTMNGVRKQMVKEGTLPEAALK